MVQFTVKEYIDVIEKNGLPQLIGSLFEFDNTGITKVVGACAIGQAAVNLKFDPLHFSAHNIENSDKLCSCEPAFPMTLRSATIHLNDYHRFDFALIAKTLRRAFKKSFDSIITIETNHIIYHI